MIFHEYAFPLLNVPANDWTHRTSSQLNTTQTHSPDGLEYESSALRSWNAVREVVVRDEELFISRKCENQIIAISLMAGGKM